MNSSSTDNEGIFFTDGYDGRLVQNNSTQGSQKLIKAEFIPRMIEEELKIKKSDAFRTLAQWSNDVIALTLFTRKSILKKFGFPDSQSFINEYEQCSKNHARFTGQNRNGL